MLPTPEAIEQLLPYLSDAERDELIGLIARLNRVWLPLPGAQMAASMSTADIIGFGGAAGGGKSDWLLGTALTKHTKSLIMREQAVQLPGLTQRLTDMLGSRDGFNGQDKIWNIPGTNKTITFGSAQFPEDWMKYQGRARDFLGLDEASNFLESVVRALMGWVRTTDADQPCQVGMGFNPPTNAAGRWIIKFFAPWLDPNHLAPALPGELRYFGMIDGEETELPDGVPFLHKGALVRPKSRTFIPSRVEGNPYLMATGYRDTLEAFPEPLRSQMLYGDFMAGVMDDPWQVIPTAWVEAAMRRWRELEVKPPMDSMGVDVARGGTDQTVIARRHGWWFDKLLAFPGKSTPDGYEVKAQILTAQRNDAVVHIDVIGVGASPYDLLKNVTQTVGVDARLRASGPDETGKLTFANVRSQMWWRMRELLNPEANNNIMLPSDPDLLKELTAPTWRPVGDGGVAGTVVRVESREDIIKRLGYSPDRATAVVQCAMETPKIGSLPRSGGHSNARRDYNPFAEQR